MNTNNDGNIWLCFMWNTTQDTGIGTSQLYNNEKIRNQQANLHQQG
jgi:hypothetical protein